MNLLRITTRIYPDKSGPAKQAFLLSNYLSKKGHKVINLACNPYKYRIKERRINQNFKIYYLPLTAPGINANIIRLILFFIQFYILALIKSFQIIRKENINIVHSHSPAPSGFISYFIKKIYNIPYIYTIHGIEKIFKIIHILDFIISVNHSEKCIVVSKQLKEHLSGNFNLNNLVWIPNGIDINDYHHVKNKEKKKDIIKLLNLRHFLDKNDIIISYIGYMFFKQKVKGMIDFLEAFERSITKLDENVKKRIKLLFIGEGEFSPYLKNHIINLKMEKNVLFLGYRKEIPSFLAISDLLALTSYLEGGPNVILEAMASRVPCLGSNVGDIPLMIKDTGFIVEPGDTEQISKYLLEFYNLSENQKSDLRSAAFQRVKELFSNRSIGMKFIKVYQNILTK
ncbi:MAG: glycosyltransferase [Candidatus Lokiarchaeota archaeon]|nr:glycosyltransferase [Candidatus Lokiarchaeota archaeon]MBD3201170.1 glycosyltransferase [Candidatus Lokiarchaeota archaeon]